MRVSSLLPPCPALPWSGRVAVCLKLPAMGFGQEKNPKLAISNGVSLGEGWRIVIVEVAACWSWEPEQRIEVIRVRLGHHNGPRLGAAWLGLGWPVVVRTDRLGLPRACAPGSGRWEGSEDLPRGAHLGWPENADTAVLAVQTSSSGRHSTATTHFHSAGPGCKEHWRSLLSIHDRPSQSRLRLSEWPACSTLRNLSLCQGPRLPLGKSTSFIVVGPTQKSHAHRRICLLRDHLHNRPTAKKKGLTDLDLLVTQARST